MLYTVLVVDDDPDVRGALAELLGSEGYHVLTAEHGGRALDLLAVSSPALVLTDLSMPVLNGWDLVRAIRGAPEWADLPVVVFSADGFDHPPSGVAVVPKCGGPERLLRVIERTLTASTARPLKLVGSQAPAQRDRGAPAVRAASGHRGGLRSLAGQGRGRVAGTRA